MSIDLAEINEMKSLNKTSGVGLLNFAIFLNVAIWALGSLNTAFPIGVLPDYFVLVLNSAFFLVLFLNYFFVNKRVPKVFGYFSLVCFSFFVSAVLSDYMVVSLLKVVKYYVVCGFLFLSYYYLSNDKAEDSLAPIWLLWFFRVLGLASIFTIFLGVAWNKNQTGFNGVLDHPQKLALYSGAWCVCEQFAFYRKKQLVNFVFSLLAAAFVFMSEARTAIASLLVASFFMFAIKQREGFGYKNIVVIFVVISVSILGANKIYEGLQASFLKRSDSSVLQGLKDSRGELMLGSLKNFLDEPYLGIGFQVSNGRYGTQPMDIQYSGGLPLSAPIEKGVFYSGMFEEVGIIGGFLFLSFVAYLAQGFLGLRKSIIIYWALVNMGEAIFFSTGGVGVLLWIMLAYNAPFARRHI